MRKIIVNSTPLIALAKANKLEILKGLYEHIIIPEAVYREVTEKDDVAAQRIEAAREWIEVCKVDSSLDRRMYKAKLHDGEVEARKYIPKSRCPLSEVVPLAGSCIAAW